MTLEPVGGCRVIANELNEYLGSAEHKVETELNTIHYSSSS